MPQPVLLRAKDLEAGYEIKRVIQGVTLDVYPGEVVLLIGHNGAGKSTLLKVLFGILPKLTGSIFYDGHERGEWLIADRLRGGMVYIPQGGGVFSDLKVVENIELGASLLPKELREDRMNNVLQIFPRLRSMMSRRAGTLSGGEQQMVVLARSLMYLPRLLMLDEPSLGLAPALVQKTLDTIKSVCRDAGVSILLVEQKIKAALTIADRVYVLSRGKVAFEGSAASLQNKDFLASVYL